MQKKEENNYSIISNIKPRDCTTIKHTQKNTVKYKQKIMQIIIIINGGK